MLRTKPFICLYNNNIDGVNWRMLAAARKIFLTYTVKAISAICHPTLKNQKTFATWNDPVFSALKTAAEIDFSVTTLNYNRLSWRGNWSGKQSWKTCDHHKSEHQAANLL